MDVQFCEEVTDSAIFEAITDVAPWLEDPSDLSAEAEAGRVAGLIRPYCIAAALAAVGEDQDHLAMFEAAVTRAVHHDPLALAAFQLFTGRLRLCLD